MEPPREQRPFDRTLFAVLCGVAVAFLGAFAFTQWRMAAIDDEVEWIAADVDLGAHSAARARGELRSLEAAVDDYGFNATVGGPRAHAAIEGARSSLAAALVPCSKLAAGVKRDTCESIAPRLEHLDTLIVRALAAADALDASAARTIIYTTLHPLTDRIDDALRELASDEREVAGKHAFRVARLRHRTPWVPFFPDALGVALAIAGAFLAWRGGRRAGTALARS